MLYMKVLGFCVFIGASLTFCSYRGELFWKDFDCVLCINPQIPLLVIFFSKKKHEST